MILGAAQLARAFLAGEQLDVVALDRPRSTRPSRSSATRTSCGCSASDSRRAVRSPRFSATRNAPSPIQAEVFDLAVQAGNDAMALQSLVAQAMSQLTLGEPARRGRSCSKPFRSSRTIPTSTRWRTPTRPARGSPWPKVATTMSRPVARRGRHGAPHHRRRVVAAAPTPT